MSGSDELVTAGQVLDWLPAGIRRDFDWCPARRAFGHRYDDCPETIEVRSWSGPTRIITIRRCEHCGTRDSTG